MLRKTLLRCSGGHGDLFPTTKAAAHLTPAWVTERHPPAPPGAGKCTVGLTRPGTRNKFQLMRPEVHEVKTVQMNQPLPHHCTTVRMSEKATASTIAGVRTALGGHTAGHRRTSGIAAANIAEKEKSEALMKTRDYAAHKSPTLARAGWEPTTDVVALTEWMYTRIHDHRKMVNDNGKGYEKEYMIWERKPDPPPVATKK